MKNAIIAIIVILFIIICLSSVRFGFPNSRNPTVTKCWGGDYGSPNYDLFDENVECYCSHDCFWVCKPGTTIERDDKCDRCGKKWKWHYNVD